MSKFHLGTASRAKLVGVHPDLIRVVETAIIRTDVDFGISEGVRTLARQQELVASGASQTLHSRHLAKLDPTLGTVVGYAVDLVAYVGATLRWDWPLYFQLAGAMQQAALECDVSVVWGGVWDREMAEYTDPQTEVARYVARREARHKRAFLDGPHFQLSERTYP